jgi:linear primary-alkylsulfatase
MSQNNMKYLLNTTLLILAVLPSGAGAEANFSDKPASSATLEVQARFRHSLPEDDGRDQEFARRGFIATLEDPASQRDDGHPVYDLKRVAWIEGDAPGTVNPGLWRQMKLLKIHGLFKVTEGVWQVRGFSGSNMTIVEGDSGWIIIDPLMSVEAAHKAKELMDKHLGQRPVSAVIYSHSHPDHFAGVRAFITGSDEVHVLAPEHFMEELTSEWLMAGNATSRRASFQLGTVLDAGRFAGVGISIEPDTGTFSLIAPTMDIKKTGEKHLVDGVKFEFQMVPETEAPAEMNFFLPDHNTFYVGEITTCTMHNIQTPRGAQVRDALKWADAITDAISRYGERAESLAMGHCWPRFGKEVINEYLALQRDNYKFIHDQTVRLMNNGLTPTEIAEQLERPPAIANEWSNRGYYGTVRHNVKGVYQRYIGWWDGNPAHLDMHPPQEQARRYVGMLGGGDNIIAEAQNAMAGGDYRWSAEILNHLVFAEPDNDSARALLADSYEQMGYQAESAVWRNIYLTGAAELRGVEFREYPFASPDLAQATPLKSLLDLIATRLDPAVIGDRDISLALDITDKDETALVTVRNAVMVNQLDMVAEDPDIFVRGSQIMLAGLFLQQAPLVELEKDGLEIRGNRELLEVLQGAIGQPPKNYPIVTP